MLIPEGCKEKDQINPLDQTIHFTTLKGLPSDFIYAVYVDMDNEVWAGTENGLCQLSGSEFLPVPIVDGNPTQPIVFAILKDQFGRIWAGTNRGVSLYDYASNTWTNYTTLFGNPFETYSLIEDQYGRIWLGTYPYGPVLLQNDAVISNILYYGDFYNASCVPCNTINYIHKDKQENIWVGSNGGLTKYDPSPAFIKMYDNTTGLPDNAVSSVYQDRFGYTWVGTKNAGSIGRIRQDSATAVDLYNYLPSNYVRDIEEDHWGRVWFTPFGDHLIYYDGIVMRPYILPGSPTMLSPSSLKKDATGSFWLGTYGNGIYKFNPLNAKPN